VRCTTSIWQEALKVYGETKKRSSDAGAGVAHANLKAWNARVAERWQGGPPPPLAQRALLAKPGFWERLQRAWAKPAFARACLEAIERRRPCPG
jgi:hypothetical protein